MAKFIFVLLALAAVAAAKPMGGAVVGHQSSVSSSSHVMNPYFGMYGLGYGMMGYPGIMGHSIASHSLHHGMMPYGYGMGMMKGLGMGMYPGGFGMGYGMMG